MGCRETRQTQRKGNRHHESGRKETETHRERQGKRQGDKDQEGSMDEKVPPADLTQEGLGGGLANGDLTSPQRMVWM